MLTHCLPCLAPLKHPAGNVEMLPDMPEHATHMVVIHCNLPSKPERQLVAEAHAQAAKPPVASRADAYANYTICFLASTLVNMRHLLSMDNQAQSAGKWALSTRSRGCSATAYVLNSIHRVCIMKNESRDSSYTVMGPRNPGYCSPARAPEAPGRLHLLSAEADLQGLPLPLLVLAQT